MAEPICLATNWSTEAPSPMSDAVPPPVSMWAMPPSWFDVPWKSMPSRMTRPWAWADRGSRIDPAGSVKFAPDPVGRQ